MKRINIQWKQGKTKRFSIEACEKKRTSMEACENKLLWMEACENKLRWIGACENKRHSTEAYQKRTFNGKMWKFNFLKFEQHSYFPLFQIKITASIYHTTLNLFSWVYYSTLNAIASKLLFSFFFFQNRLWFSVLHTIIINEIIAVCHVNADWCVLYVCVPLRLIIYCSSMQFAHPNGRHFLMHVSGFIDLLTLICPCLLRGIA